VIDHKACDDFMDMGNCKEMVLNEKIKKRHYELFLDFVGGEIR